MGNSKLANGCSLPSANPTPRASPQTGILTYVGGHKIAEAMQILPPPTRTGPEHAEAEVDTEYQGRVRIFFERRISRHHKSSHVFWSAYRAEPVHGAWDSDAGQT